jgi:hypothetical protein
MIMLSKDTLLGIVKLAKLLSDCKNDEDRINLIPMLLKLAIGRNGIGDLTDPSGCCIDCDCIREEGCDIEFTLDTYLNLHPVFTHGGIGKAVLYDEPNTLVPQWTTQYPFNIIYFPKFDKYFIRFGNESSYSSSWSYNWQEVSKPEKVTYNVFNLD